MSLHRATYPGALGLLVSKGYRMVFGIVGLVLIILSFYLLSMLFVGESWQSCK